MQKTEILSGLSAIANDYRLYAVIWHAVFYLFLAVLLARKAPSNRFTGIGFSLPLFSVSLFAWIAGNPFNGSVFVILAILVLFLALKASGQKVAFSSPLFAVIGILMISFGLAYPHFTATRSVFEYLYASPAGLIPCPTLSVLIGFMLLLNGLASKSLGLAFVVSGLLYGIFGSVRLGVWLDLFLIFGALALLVKYIFMIKDSGNHST